MMWQDLQGPDLDSGTTSTAGGEDESPATAGTVTEVEVGAAAAPGTTTADGAGGGCCRRGALADTVMAA